MNEENQNTTIETEKVTYIQNLEEAVMCDHGHSFIVKNALLIPCVFDYEDMGNVMHLDPNYIIKAGSDLSQKEGRGFLLACPLCKIVHLSGFRPTVPSASIASGVDNTIPERILSLEL